MCSPTLLNQGMLEEFASSHVSEYAWAVMRALGVRLHKPTTKDWPTAEWAVVGHDRPGEVVAHGRAVPPRNYSETHALRHLHEAIGAAIHENSVSRTLVWEIEGNARVNLAMRPRLRAEGAVCAAAVLAGSSTELVAWGRIAALASAKHSKSAYIGATTVCGVPVGDADSQAVLVAIAAMRS